MYGLCLQVKQHWLGLNYTKDGVAGNDMSRSNVPDIRVGFRHETFLEELSNIFQSFKGFAGDQVTNGQESDKIGVSGSKG